MSRIIHFSPVRSNAVRCVGLALTAAVGLSLLACALPLRRAYHPTHENLDARQWFQDAKFGLFIHWGVYTVLGEGERVMENKKMSIAEYEKLPQQFDPSAFDAAAWVSLAKAAGARYITITSKHYDGFAMFDTKATDWDIVDRTPYAKDALKPLAEECRRADLRLFFYYSQLDWHHPDYYPRGETGRSAGRPEKGNWNHYLNYMDKELEELLKNYGDVGGIWLDGGWDRPDANWRLPKTYDIIHRLQPAALIGNNHHRAPFRGEDFQIFEKNRPDENTTAFNADARIDGLPLEICETVNDSWGYNKSDDQFKSPRELLHELIRAAGQGANLLLNLGARPDGTIPIECQTRLEQMGRWLERNGESIHGTRAGPIAPGEWGVSTRKGRTVYLHYLAEAPGALSFPRTIGDPVGAYLFSSGAAIDVILREAGYTIEIPERILDPIDTIIVLQLESPARP